VKLTDIIVPRWLHWALLLAALGLAYGTGRLQEARHATDAAVAKTVTLVKTQVQTVTKVETVYRDRVQKIYVQEKNLVAEIPSHISPAVDEHFAIPVGFLRVAAAGWSGAAAGPADDADDQPAALSFSELAAIEVGNATSCRVWREQALGWRDFYARQQVTFNGRAGDWYRPADGSASP
jgi:hypothetical protein